MVQPIRDREGLPEIVEEDPDVREDDDPEQEEEGPSRVPGHQPGHELVPLAAEPTGASPGISARIGQARRRSRSPTRRERLRRVGGQHDAAVAGGTVGGAAGGTVGSAAENDAVKITDGVTDCGKRTSESIHAWDVVWVNIALLIARGVQRVCQTIIPLLHEKERQGGGEGGAGEGNRTLA